MGGPRHVLILTSHELTGIRELIQLVATDSEGTFDNTLVRRAHNMLRKTADIPLTDVPVLLTLSEARALATAFSSADVTSTTESVLQSKTKVEAAERAAKKVSDALQERQSSRRR